MRRLSGILLAVAMLSGAVVGAQTPAEEYEAFRRGVNERYDSFRRECNAQYAEFLKTVWQDYSARPAVPSRDKYKRVPPVVYDGNAAPVKPVEVTPREVPVVEEPPQPMPVAPVRETPAEADRFEFDFYGLRCGVRMPPEAKLRGGGQVTADRLSRDWNALCTPGMDNALRDCLEARLRYRLCDWAYLQFLDRLGREYCGDADAGLFVTAFLFCQSGYQMRLAIDAGGRLVLLYGSRHSVFDTPYFYVDGLSMYPYGSKAESLRICPMSFEGEKPLSLLIAQEQNLGGGMSEPREIKSKRYADVVASASVPQQLVEFYNGYPASAVDHDPMTKWAICAEAPFSRATSETLYAALRPRLEGLTPLEAAQRLLNWVQTGLVYEYDDKVWGGDRAFFAEETLYYPYCDCEDRAILFSRLVRDLLGLEVALVYYPGHLATAVCFGDDAEGDAMTVDGRRFLVCDPTYIGAPVGRQMRGVDGSRAEAILLKK